jgi:hypothetical protein
MSAVQAKRMKEARARQAAYLAMRAAERAADAGGQEGAPGSATPTAAAAPAPLTSVPIAAPAPPAPAPALRPFVVPPPASPYQLKLDSAFEPVIYEDVHLELCPALAEIIFARSATMTSTPSINRGGWKSPETFFSWGDRAIAQLARTLIGLLGARPTGWAMVNRHGSEHPRHQHRIAIVSAIFYVTTGDPIVPTVFECGDGSELEIEPSPGRLVIFPGDMWHRVPRYEGDAPRITIALDVRR